MEMAFFYGCDPAEGDPQLDLLNRVGCLPEIELVSDEFADLTAPLPWALRKRLDELFGEILMHAIEGGYAAGVTAARMPLVTINDN